ncbi:MAG: ShlB/FhaC/HecB family hemolysin secretion/activation protein [Brasilonema octagenarum HA4186-MV1]|jgi:hemolysin activation/secretion protein|uniref:ShlB/FhaC/HecB family hemolysin secretion/activation protein n=2 Tax=Brasilonema TaxID=383614 RepID=A0A856MDX7_9CYAN|nr:MULTISPECIES: ShlB/FhaC/HecB family hemolysin secretion/activation protein [Brasilonema]MBW4624682.1 ShlB/FhaC/HecB family hemolysin secretion/activation protein [Brasilonema octagenarum HA4186-MV1]NMF65114.1 ShlB/FhaC/HecB family hemolysin secretion/activation protein [Brasilonema octagenarum UFV-OR1]QDL08500.1 ShlB/FhaC/HecB family hemolysin secretion/activation protein [Brasilonema sennae CENA114]QDL14855.1 ShlB/FhaC/HecB family hemolysin secretion/activation protein [Brasilonema octagena
MNRGGQLGFGNLNLAVALLINMCFFLPQYKASAQKLINEGYKSEVLPPKFQISTDSPKSSPKSIGSTAILSQVPNPITPEPPLPAPQPIPTPEPSPQIPLDVTPSTPPTTPFPPESRPGVPGTLTVKEFEIVGNKKKIFSKEKLREITKKFTGRAITFAELLQVETEITKLYTDAGYVNSAAVINVDDQQPLPQQGAVIKIQIIEGGVEEIKVTGTRRLNPDYIRSRIALATSTPLNRFRLLEALQLLQLNPLIKNISADLSTGSRSDQNLVEVRIVEADSFRTELFVDNGRAPSVGSFRRGLRITEGNVFGLGDSFGATYTNTDGSNALDLSYALPVNPRNGTLNVAGGFTDTTIVEPPFDRIDIIGDSFYIDVGFRQPIFQSPTQELALGLTFSREQSKTTLLGRGDVFQNLGADKNGETRISALRFIQEYTQRNSQQVFGFRSQFTLGVGFFDATTNGTTPDSRFFSWRGQGQYIRQLARDTLLVLRSDLQLATRALVPLEQISVGGIQSVRGYRQDEFLVDNGFFASAEVRFPILRVEEVKGVLQLIPFVDFGVGWNNSIRGRPNPVLDPNTLIGVGLGLRWQMDDKLDARIDYGIPLTDVNSRDRTLQEQGLYFSINYSPF